MLILAKDVEALQNQILDAYFNYRNARDRLKIAQKATQTMNQYFSKTKIDNPSLETLMQALYDNVRLEESTSQQDYISKRNTLSMLVGPDAVAALDTSWDKEKKGS
jgi:outer membrane protein TolC